MTLRHLHYCLFTITLLVIMFVYSFRFESCVNDSMVEHYGLSARLYLLEGCRAHPDGSPAALHGSPDDLDIWQRAFLAVLAAIMALTMVSTVLDLTLPEHARKGS